MNYSKYDNVNDLVGKTIKAIYMDTDKLVSDTDAGLIAYVVDGDCCSTSYFYDFQGVKKLLAGNPVISTKAIDLEAPDDEDSRKGDVVEAYGFEIVTEDPQFGEVTSVFSFRNDSNGYYGGTLYRADSAEPMPKRQITDDTAGLEIDA